MNGIELVTPTSVTKVGVTATVNTNGSVSFAACDSLSLNGVFTSTYTNYLVVCSISDASGDFLRFRFRASGTDNTSTADYNHQSLTVSGAVEAGARATTLGYITIGEIVSTGLGTTAGLFTINVYGPQTSNPTTLRSSLASRLATFTRVDTAGSFDLTNSFDGFTIYMPTGNITGLLCVYGLVA